LTGLSAQFGIVAVVPLIVEERVWKKMISRGLEERRGRK
jgi:hypothetical protein